MHSLMASRINGILDPNEVSEIVECITVLFGAELRAEYEKAADKTIPLETLEKMIAKGVQAGFSLAKMNAHAE